MSVNLNILANKALRPFADVDDIFNNMTIYVSGSPNIVYAANNIENVKLVGLPQQNNYCVGGTLEWSTDPTFQTAVTSSSQNCNSSSLSGSLLWYGSFANNNQSGGVLNNYLGYQVKIFDYNIPNPGQFPTSSYSGKSYYFRNRKYADIGLTGSYSSPIVSTQLTKPIGVQTNANIPAEYNLYRCLNLYDANGYNDVTKEWIANIPPTLPIGFTGAVTNPTPYSGKATIATGSLGFPTIAKYGNLGSDVILTKGATFTLPMTGSPDNIGVFFQICLIEGSVTGVTNGASSNIQFSINCGNSYSLPPTGSEVYGSLKATTFYYTGLDTRNGIVSFVRDRRDDQGPPPSFPLQYRLRVNGVSIPNPDSVGPVFPSDITSVTLSTSDNAVLRFVAGGRWAYYTYENWPSTFAYEAGDTCFEQYDYYKEVYGTYTGSLYNP